MLSEARHLKSFALGIVLSVDETATPKSSGAPSNSSAEDAAKSVIESSSLLDPSSKLSNSSLPSLAGLVRTACPMLNSLRCLSPPAGRLGKRPFTEFYEPVCAGWCEKRSEWNITRTVERDDGIFGMVNPAR